METGKKARYLRYAIGEIVLVVFGILIALQVNNWNEDRLKKNSARQNLKALVKDVENDLVQLERLNKLVDTTLLYTSRLNEHFQKSLEVTDSTALYIFYLILEDQIKPHRNVIQTLNENGEFAILETSLQNQISNYYQLIEKVQEREEISNTFIKIRFEPYFFENYSYFVNKNNPFKDAQEYFKGDLRASIIYDTKSFLEDKHLEALIFGRFYQMQQQKDYYIKAISAANSLLKELKAI